MAGVCLLSALPMLGSFAGGTLKAVATGMKYLNKAETMAKYLTLGTKLVSYTAQTVMSGHKQWKRPVYSDVFRRRRLQGSDGHNRRTSLLCGRDICFHRGCVIAY